MKKLFRLLLHSLLFSLVYCCVSCATLSLKPPERLYYTLRLGEKIKNIKPYPDMIPIYVDWHMSDGNVKSHLGFRGWDFNHQGSISMLEVLSEEGTVVSTVFDFNTDGTIDLTRNL